jgi:hypothetical protein
MSEQARFYSKCPNYTILKRATVLNVQNGIPILEHGEKIEFESHEFNTADPAVIEFLRQHKALGVDFVEDKPEQPAKKGSKAAV